MTDDEFADLLNSAGVMEASTRNDLAHLEGYDTYNFNSFTQQPLEHMGGNPPDMWIHGLPSTAVGINTPAPFDPLGGLMMGDGSWAGNNNATYVVRSSI